MSFEDLEKVPTQEFVQPSGRFPLPPVYLIRMKPDMSPIDFNLEYILRYGWTETERLRFHYKIEHELPIEDSHLKDVLSTPHIFLRHFNFEEDELVSINVSLEGDMMVLSNAKRYAKDYVNGLFLNCPPLFMTPDDFKIIKEGWVTDMGVWARFSGIVNASKGWVPKEMK